MKPTRDMTADELRDEIRERKISAFDQCTMLLKASPQTLAASGHKSPLGPIEFAIKMNEARMKDFEKTHKD